MYGLDYSFQMLRKGSGADSSSNLIRGSGEILPFRDAIFDLIFCVNAIHHFERIDAFIGEARRLFRQAAPSRL
jgi:ubiquinone/menaquinone biosynthesis C-methylase UbiE